MSFDVFLLSFRDGRNGPADAAAARAVLERYKFRHEPEFDAFHVEFSDGSSVEMFSGGLDGATEEFDGAMFALRGSSEGIGEFIFEFSRAAGCVIVPAMEPACVLLPRDDLAAHLPADLTEGREQINVGSGPEVLAALRGGYESWKAYRNQVVRPPDNPPAS